MLFYWYHLVGVAGICFGVCWYHSLCCIPGLGMVFLGGDFLVQWGDLVWLLSVFLPIMFVACLHARERIQMCYWLYILSWLGCTSRSLWNGALLVLCKTPQCCDQRMSLFLVGVHVQWPCILVVKWIFSNLNIPHSWFYADSFILIREGCTMFSVITDCLIDLSHWLAVHSVFHPWITETK